MTSMFQVTLGAASLVASLVVAHGVVPAAGQADRQVIRLERTILNLEYAVFALESRPPRGVLGPSDGEGIFFGTLMRRLPGDGQSSKHYVPFAVRYRESVAVQAWCDLNDNRDLTDDPEIPLTGHPRSPRARAFIVDLRWTAQSSGRAIPIDRKVRIVLDSRTGEKPPTAREQVVFGMVGKIRLSGATRDLVLFDGNGDGLYTKDFRDGFFVDHDGDRHFVIDQTSEHFGPLGVPFKMGNRLYEVEVIEPEGRSLILLDRASAEPVAVRKEIGGVAPDFEYRSTTGRVGRLSDHRGSYVALYFWASWCGACATQAPALVELQKTYGDRGLIFLGVSFDTDREAMERFRAMHGESWPTTFSGHMLWEDPIGRLYQIDGAGTICLIDPEGRLEGIYVDPAQLKSRLSQMFTAGTVAGKER